MILDWRIPRYEPQPWSPLVDEYRDWVSFFDIWVAECKQRLLASWRMLHISRHMAKSSNNS